MRRALVFLWLSSAAARATPSEDAAAAIRELRWRDARAVVDGALGRGNLDRESWLLLQRQAAEIAVVLDGPEAAEAEFRKLLVIDPEQTAPLRRGPVVMAPFERARRWVEQHGALKVTLQAPPQATSAETPIEVRVSGDSLALVSGARVRVRAAGAFSRLPGKALSIRLPTAGEEAVYYVEVIDETDNVLLTLGTNDEPLRLRKAPPPPKPSPVEPPPPPRPPPPERHGLRNATIGVGVASLVLLGVGIGLDLAAVSEFDSLRGRCAPYCTGQDLLTFRLERDFAYGAYALAAGGAASTLIMMIVQLSKKTTR